jgi:hypothetical protein
VMARAREALLAEPQARVMSRYRCHTQAKAAAALLGIPPARLVLALGRARPGLTPPPRRWRAAQSRACPLPRTRAQGWGSQATVGTTPRR